MKAGQKIAAGALVLLLAATVYVLWRTGRPTGVLTGRPGAGSPTQQVDQTPLLNVKELVQLPKTVDELPFASDALHLADQEMDLAFAAAVQHQEEHPPALNPEAKAIQAHIQNSENALDADNERVKQLTAAEEQATGMRKDALDDQLEQAKAQAELDQDQIDEAKEDLARAGGDQQGRMEALRQQHDAASKVADTMEIKAATSTEARGLINRYQQWSSLHAKQMLLWRAKHDAETSAALFADKHNQLEARVAAGSSNTAQTGQLSDATLQTSAAIVAATKRQAGDQKALTNFDRRIDDERQLAGVYSGWIGVVAAQQRSVINHAMRGVLIILLIALVALFFERWLATLLGKLKLDRRQLATLRAVTRVTLQVVAVLFILLVIFGPPNQLGTILGLAGAGLTVALKDFIVGFLGWFVLMGKNGIRLGDWVEINGVTGEVVELGMFHTVLLETGNWTDSGHPTGRRVTFTNSFAIEGHYFNFSTSGQWLWDELHLVVPTGQDPYTVVDAIQKKVSEATEQGAAEAEREWKGSAASRELSSLSAAPAINIKPVIGGVEVSVRYITRAHERYQLRAKLYQAAVELLGQKPPAYQPEKLTARV